MTQLSDFGVATRADKPVSEATIKAGSVGVQSGTTMVQFAQEVLWAAIEDGVDPSARDDGADIRDGEAEHRRRLHAAIASGR